MPKTKTEVQRSAKQWRVRNETIATVNLIANEIGMFEGAVIDRAVACLIEHDPLIREAMQKAS